MQISEYKKTRIVTEIPISDNKVMVMVDVMGDKSISRLDQISNIYCLDKTGNIIWRVREIKTNPPFEDDGFVHLAKDQSGEFIAGRFSGFVYKINPETGEAVQTGFRK